MVVKGKNYTLKIACFIDDIDDLPNHFDKFGVNLDSFSKGSEMAMNLYFLISHLGNKWILEK